MTSEKLIESLLPDGIIGSDGIVRNELKASARALIDNRLKALPLATRLAIATLLALFNISAVATIHRPFCIADTVSGRRHIQRVFGLRFVPFAELIRLYRALIFLAVFSTPALRIAMDYPLPTDHSSPRAGR